MALKCFEKKSFIENLKNKKSFFNEIEMLKILNSPFIIHFDYVYESEKAYYLKM
jgi:serine/threonine protein kinase